MVGGCLKSKIKTETAATVSFDFQLLNFHLLFEFCLLTFDLFIFAKIETEAIV